MYESGLLQLTAIITRKSCLIKKKKKNLISYSFKPSTDALLCGQIQPFGESTVFGGVFGVLPRTPCKQLVNPGKCGEPHRMWFFRPEGWHAPGFSPSAIDQIIAPALLPERLKGIIQTCPGRGTGAGASSRGPASPRLDAWALLPSPPLILP